ncbi:MAG: hypothetical protein U9Q66_01410 [Patescibacteria group bacterium]|nr:hypothetical protein [Patescibacteria group bacterium]
MILIFIVVLLATFNILFHLSIMKQVKISELLPYDNMDKLFIVVI